MGDGVAGFDKRVVFEVGDVFGVRSGLSGLSGLRGLSGLLCVDDICVRQDDKGGVETGGFVARDRGRCGGATDGGGGSVATVHAVDGRSVGGGLVRSWILEGDV